MKGPKFTILLATTSGSSDDETKHSLTFSEQATESSPRVRIREKEINSLKRE
jgi:hypothetical protein